MHERPGSSWCVALVLALVAWLLPAEGSPVSTSTVILVPDGSTNPGWTLAGAATAHEAVAASDAKTVAARSITWAGALILDFDGSPLAGRRIRRVRALLRTMSVDPAFPNQVNVYLVPAGSTATYDQAPNLAAAGANPPGVLTDYVGAWLTHRPGGGAWSVADLSNLRAHLTHEGSAQSLDATTDRVNLEVEYFNGPPTPERLGLFRPHREVYR